MPVRSFIFHEQKTTVSLTIDEQVVSSIFPFMHWLYPCVFNQPTKTVSGILTHCAFVIEIEKRKTKRVGFEPTFVTTSNEISLACWRFQPLSHLFLAVGPRRRRGGRRFVSFPSRSFPPRRREGRRRRLPGGRRAPGAGGGEEKATVRTWPKAESDRLRTPTACVAKGRAFRLRRSGGLPPLPEEKVYARSSAGAKEKTNLS